MRAMTETTTGEPRRLLIHWLLFFVIALGIGYPAVSRFDPRTVPGCADASKYYEMVTGEPKAASQQLLRPLVPSVARPIYQLSAGRLPSWDPVAFGLLIASALFSATGALILLHIGRVHVGAPAGTALAATLLYFLNFAVHNKHLGCGLVDSGESSVMLALYWVLFTRKFFLLPIVGLIGALAKETFIPLATIATLGWAAAELWRRRPSPRLGLWLLAMIVVGLSVNVLLQYAAYDRLILPWQFAAQIRDDPWARDVSLLTGLIGCLTDRQFWYIFGWLLPLGALRLKDMPVPWLGASLGGGAAALAMGAWINAGGVAAPAIFNAVGPILSLSAAAFLTSAPRRTPNST
jgi:hypothetical protein